MVDRAFIRKVAIVSIVTLTALLIPSSSPISADETGCDICWCEYTIPFIGTLCNHCVNKSGACDFEDTMTGCHIVGWGCYAIVIRG